MLILLITELYIIGASVLLLTLVKLIKAYRNQRYQPTEAPIDDKDLPTISVCIPARNETNVMAECIETVLASDYPKLEIIVLDDNSTDNTSHLIRAFAHSGVRFIEGKLPPDGWLGKNYALKRLLDESSGRYILFMDVDTRISKETIGLLVEQMKQRQLSMLSVIPQRNDVYRPGVWFGSLRYFWEIILSTRSLPGTSSAIWLVEQRALGQDLDGFSRWKDEVQPELHIASEFAKTDEYRLIISTPKLGVTQQKKWSSQVESSRRLLLPRFGNSILSSLVAASLILSVIFPQAVAVLALIEGSWWLFAAELFLGLLATVIIALYFKIIWFFRWWLGFFLAPYVVWQELILLISSILSYQKGAITWKDRSVDRPSARRSVL